MGPSNNDTTARTAITRGRPLRGLWELIIGTGIETSTEVEPNYLRWFAGLPLVSWLVGLIAIAVALSLSDEMLREAR